MGPSWPTIRSMKAISVFALVLVGCVPPDPPAPATPPPPPPSTALAEGFARADQQQAEQEASARAQQEAQERQLRELTEQGNKATAAALEQRRKAAEAERESEAARCSKTRPARAKELQAAASEVKRWRETMATHGAWFVSHCELADTSGTRVTVQRESATTAVVRTSEVGRADDVKCTGRAPVNVSKDWIRWQIAPHHAMRKDGWRLMLVPSDDRDCRALDRAVGLNADVSGDDVAGIQALIDWKQP